jgi:hypothetical protein
MNPKSILSTNTTLGDIEGELGDAWQKDANGQALQRVNKRIMR